MSDKTNPLASAKIVAAAEELAGVPPVLNAPVAAQQAPQEPAKSSGQGEGGGRRSKGSGGPAASPEAKGAAASPEPPLPSPGAAPVPLDVFEVEEDGVYYSNGLRVRLPKGKRVSLATHDALALERMREAGIKLRRVVA